MPAVTLSPHFALAEFLISQTAAREGIDNTPSAVVVSELRMTAELLERVRTILGEHPILISSGYRSPQLNLAVGGVVDSAHVWGGAADFTVPGFGEPLDVIRAITPHLDALSVDQIIWEFGTWVHIGRAPPMRKARHEVLTIDRIGARLGLV
jgi:zinc D-Ala-D-Ala carboxypeptidase